MTTLCAVEKICPVCDGAFESRTVVATDTLGGKRTDFTSAPTVRSHFHTQ
jgi:hypothetical protein